MKTSMTLTAAGDALITRSLSCPPYEGFIAVGQFIRRGQARLVNLESTLADAACPGNTFSGGTWLRSEDDIPGILKAFGFTYAGFANNHTLDYGADGLLRTIRMLKECGLYSSGAGSNLYEASRPAIIELPTARIGIISVSATFNAGDPAGAQSAYMTGRPGLNPLHHDDIRIVTPDQLEQLKQIARDTHLNDYDDLLVRQGFAAAPEDGLFAFGGILFQSGESGGNTSIPHKGDLARITASIRDTRRTCDYALVMMHSHENKRDSEDEPADFVESFARACVDAGACAVIGGGTHRLKPIELYKGKPIFYSLGNFAFQNAYVSQLPTDFMQKLGIDERFTAAQGLEARKALATAPLAASPDSFRSVIPLIHMEEDELRSLTMLPLSLGMNLPVSQRNWPRSADTDETKAICEKLNLLSNPYGTKVEISSDGLLAVRSL